VHIEWEKMDGFVDIFRSNAEITGVFHSLFGGFYLFMGIPFLLQTLLLVLIPALTLCVIKGFQSSTKLSRGITYTLGFFAFCVLCLFTLQPWDEIFINLRHSQYLAEFNRFSFDPLTNIEATVDFLVYFALGMLSKMGLPLLSGVFFQGMLGGFLCTLAIQKNVESVSEKKGGLIPFALACLCPVLVFNASNGFANVWFAACLLWAVFYLFFSEKNKSGFFLLALLPLIRMEGVFHSLLVFIFYIRQKKQKYTLKKFLLAVLGISLPFASHCLFRHFYYHEIIPIPVQYKSSPFVPYFWAIGLSHFLADLLAGGVFLSCFSFLLKVHRFQNFQL
jgi:hypothetical protein